MELIKIWIVHDCVVLSKDTSVDESIAPTSFEPHVFFDPINIPVDTESYRHLRDSVGNQLSERPLEAPAGSPEKQRCMKQNAAWDLGE